MPSAKFAVVKLPNVKTVFATFANIETLAEPAVYANWAAPAAADTGSTQKRVPFVFAANTHPEIGGNPKSGYAWDTSKNS